MDYESTARIPALGILCTLSRVFSVGVVVVWVGILCGIVVEYAHSSVGIFGAFSLDSVREAVFGRKEDCRMKNTIHVERAIKRITQADLAAAVGVSRQTINAIEANKYVPSAVLALKIARYFAKPVEAIFELGEDD